MGANVLKEYNQTKKKIKRIILRIAEAELSVLCSTKTYLIKTIINYNSRSWLAISGPIWALIRQCTRHMLVIGQYASFCAGCCGALCLVNCWVIQHSCNDVLKSFCAQSVVYSFLEFCQFWLIGNRTSCRPIRSVIILMIKNGTPASRSSDFINYSYDYSPNWTAPLSPMTIMNQH